MPHPAQAVRAADCEPSARSPQGSRSRGVPGRRRRMFRRRWYLVV